MENTEFSKKLEGEIRLQISLGKKSYRNVLTALNTIRKKLGGESACFKLLDEKGTEELCDALVSHLEAKGKPSNFIYPAKTNLQTLALIAKNLFAIQSSSDSDDEETTIDTTGVIKIKGHASKVLVDVVEDAIKAYYEGKPCATATRRVGQKRKGDYIRKYAWQDLEKRSNGMLKWRWFDAEVAKKRTNTMSVPSYAMRERYEILERLLNVEKGMFVSRCRATPSIPDSPNRGKPKKSMTLKELPPQVQNQWDNLAAFYEKGTIPATIPYSFYDDDALEIKMSQNQTWTVKNTPAGSARAATGKNLRVVRQYFGWLHHVHDVPLKELDLSILAHFKLLEQFKSSGVAISTVDDLSQFMAKIYRYPQSYGSRYHAPKKALKHSSPMISAQYPKGTRAYQSAAEWSDARVTLHANLLSFGVDCKKDKKSAVDDKTAKEVGGTKNVNWAIKYKDKGGKVKDHVNGIVGAVDKCIRPMIKLLSKKSDDKYNVLNSADSLSCGRTAAFCALSLARPLRLANTSCIRLLDESCRNVDVDNLVWETMWTDESGNYRIFVPKIRLKNSGGKAITDVDITINKGTENHIVITRWLKIRKQALMKAGKKSEWFLMSVVAKSLGDPLWYLDEYGVLKSNGGRTYQRRTLEGLIGVLGQERAAELEIFEGINAHAWRHIGAHYILGLSNHDTALAAHFIMDSVDMIISTYGRNHHGRQSDKLAELFANIAA